MSNTEKMHKANQAAFNGVWRGLKSQGFERSVVYCYGGALCSYRGAGGRKCAAGWLIKNSEYDPNMEGRSAISLRGNFPVFGVFAELGLPVPSETIDLLQEIHDGTATPHVLEERLRLFAKRFALEIPND